MALRVCASTLTIALVVALPALVDAQPAPAPPAVESAELQQIFDDALAALGREDYEAAIDGFDRVVVESSGQLRARAGKLGQHARRQQAKAAAVAPGSAPGSSPGSAPSTETAVADAAPVSEDDDPGAGRIRTVSSSTLMGLLVGAWIADLADVGNNEVVAPLLVFGGAGAGLVGSFYATDGRRVTAGMGDAYNLGLGIGFLNGILLFSPVGLSGSEQGFGFTLGGMAVGGAAGLAIAHRGNATVGQASFAGTLSLLGVATASLGPVIFKVDDDLSTDTYLLVATAGLDLGAIAGVVLGRNLTWSKKRARIVAMGSLAGAVGGLLLGGPIAAARADGDEDTFDRVAGSTVAASMLIGAYGGTAFAIHLTRDEPSDPRFLTDEGPPVQVAPTVINGSPGLIVGGSF